MDIGRAFTFPFEDPNWLKKLLIGGALLFIPIFGWLVVGGYWMRVIRAAYAGSDVPLPEWNEFGEDFILGLKGAVAMFIWWLPFLAIFMTVICLSIPFWLISDTSKSAAIAPFAILSAFGWMGVSLASFVFQIVMLAIQPMVLGRIAVAGDLSAGFQVSEIVREIRRVPVPLLIVMGLEYGVRSLAGFGIILCFIGLAFTIFGGFVPLSHLYGQLRKVVEQDKPVSSVPVSPA